MRRSMALMACATVSAGVFAGCTATPTITEVSNGGGGSAATAASPSSTQAARSKDAFCAVARDKEGDINASGVYYKKFPAFYAALQALEALAPDEIRAEVEGLVKDLAPLRDLEPDERNRASIPITEREEFMKRMRAFADYLEQECGYDMGTTTSRAPATSVRRSTTSSTAKESTDTTVSRLAQLREYILANHPDETWVPKINSHSISTIGSVTKLELGSVDGPPFTVAEALEACEGVSGWLYADPTRVDATITVSNGSDAAETKIVTREGKAGICQPV